MRLIKDGVYVKNEYDIDTYLIKSEISDVDKKKIGEDRLLLWDCDHDLTIHSANLLSYDGKEFPPILEKQKELWYLSMTSQLTNKLNEASFIKTLRGLQISGGNLKLKKDTIFDNLLYLHIGRNISFQKENLPCLRTLSCKYKEGILNELYKYDIFDHLALKTVNDNILEQIVPIKSLYGLQINGGKLDNIDGISNIKSLYWLSLDSLSNLTGLDELSKIEHLEHLQIGYCKHIRDWSFLLDLLNLKTLWIPVSSFKDLPSQEIVDTLVSRGVKGITKGS